MITTCERCHAVVFVREVSEEYHPMCAWCEAQEYRRQRKARRWP